MGIKQSVEEHIGLFFLGTLAIGFTAGWGAFSAVQLASGYTSISVDRLKQLEGPEALQKKVLQEKLDELILEEGNLRRQLATNRPTTGNYVRNVVLTPASPATLKIGESIHVKFLYVLSKGEVAHIWTAGDGPTSHYGAPEVKGSGSGEGDITGNAAGKVRDITIKIGGDNQTTLYEMHLPVDYTFK